MTDILVNLDQYNVPLDLLLDLIKKNEIDIYDIPINFITKEYLNAIRENTIRGIEVQVEFLYLAATLLNIKTKMLLPKKEDIEDDDPRTNLVDQLIVYSRFKYAADELSNRYNYNLKSYDRLMSADLFSNESIYIIQYNLDRLSSITNNIIKNFISREDFEEEAIISDKYTIEELSNYIVEKVNILGKTSLRELSKDRDKEFLITAFLSILDLLNSEKIVYSQNNLFDDIYINIV
ncbi:MAG: segregation/condensation protein A [Firmicutes bacterium]|nr:segregation/condensation protein A [Bacillota bacterium]